MRHWVFFETITPAYEPLVRWHLFRGDRVSVFDFDYRLKTMPWLRNAIHAGKIERIYVHNGSRADGLSAETADRYYAIFPPHPLADTLQQRFGAEEISWPFRYALAQEVFRYHYMRLYLDQRVQREGALFHIRLVPELFCVWHERLQQDLPTLAAPSLRFTISRWARGYGQAVHEIRKRWRYFQRYGRVLATLLWRRAASRPHSPSAAKEPQEFSCVVAIDSPFQTQFSGLRRFDFLLDQRRLHTGNTLFLVSQTGEGPWEKEAAQAGYAVIRWRDLVGRKSLPWLWRACVIGFRSMGAPDWVQEAAWMGLWLTVKETELFERIRMKRYVYTNLYGLAHRWRNVLIRHQGGESWCYAYSSGGTFTRCTGGAFAGDQDFGEILRIWAFENPDHWVLSSRPLIDYHRRHRQRTQHYHDVGNLWSEQVLHWERTTDRGALLRDWFGRPVQDCKVIGWFDSSFVEAPNSPSTFREGVQWYRDILRLLAEDPRWVALIKPSKDADYYIRNSSHRQWAFPREGLPMLEVWDQLKRNPRVRFLDRKTDPALVVAMSDLIVTYPYTAVSSEALGAGKAGIWYEPGERWRGTLYDRSPGLVAHGYEELKAAAERFLFILTPEAYRAHLERNVRGLIDTFLDGRGISRFRSLLVGAETPAGDSPQVFHHEESSIASGRQG